MKKDYIKKDLKEVEPSFKMSEVNEDFITLEALKNKESQQEKVNHLYPTICNYNQRTVLQRFIEKLNDRFGDRLLIEADGLCKYNLIERNGDDLYEDKNFDYLFGSRYTLGHFLTFSIDNYIYYIQFNDNPFFEDSSYITTKKVWLSPIYGKYAVQEYYGGGYNINDLIEDLFSKECDIEKAAIDLFSYFMDKHFQIEGNRYTGKQERLTLLKKDFNEIIILED